MAHNATLQVPSEKLEALKNISNLSVESLNILAELSKRPTVEKKLKANELMLKAIIK
jgi:hypothetical protein